MKRGRNTLILLAIGLGLGAYIYFVESKREPVKPDGEAPETHAKVFSADAAKIEEITVKGAAGESTTLKKTNKVWQIAAPVQTAADETEVDGPRHQPRLDRGTAGHRGTAEGPRAVRPRRRRGSRCRSSRPAMRRQSGS